MTIVTDRPAAPEVRPRVEPPDVLDFTISWEDIRQGEPRSSYRCAAARAIRRLGYVQEDDVAVHPATKPRDEDWGVVWAGDRNYVVTQELANWILRFDRGQPVEPERFVLPRC